MAGRGPLQRSLGGGQRGRFQFLEPGAELEAREQLAQGRGVAAGRGQRRRGGQIGQVADDGDQLAAERQEIQVAAQVVADHAADFTGMGDDAVERAVLFEPFDGRLRAALLHARHAVNAVADQRQVIDHLRRRHAELRRDPGLVEQFVAHRVEPAHVRADQLSQVLVAGGNQRFHAVDRSTRGQRGDHVVGLDPVDHQQRPAGGPDRGMQRFDLADHFRRHRWPVRLVFRVPVVAEGLALGIEDDRLVVRLVVAFQPA